MSLSELLQCFKHLRTVYNSLLSGTNGPVKDDGSRSTNRVFSKDVPDLMWSCILWTLVKKMATTLAAQIREELSDVR